MKTQQLFTLGRGALAAMTVASTFAALPTL